MTRTLKGTRIRGLPPKVLLSQRQDATGSYPTVWRTASDNRTGKYPVFFNDNKVITFNQPVTNNVGISVPTYPEYEEKQITVGSLGNPVNSVAVSYSYPFSGVPMVVLTEITPNTGTPTVNAFLIGSTINGILIGFSAPFEGTIVYRAVFLSSPGQPVNVVRSPRFTNQYSLVVNQGAVLTAENNSYLTFSDFGSSPPENYVTFFDFYSNNQADISASIPTSYITNTSVQVTASATATNVLYYMGVGPSTASIDVTGIVYPLVMTPQAINAGLSQQDKTDLYKQPYFSGSVIVNQPIVASGSMVKGVSDLFVTFTPGQDIEPFVDVANPEADAKSLAATSATYQFYATGSLVETTGLGFQQPVWSKNKIEIDITPASVQSFTLYKSASVGSYPMGYWNPNTRLYEGIGTGKGIDSYTGNLNGLRGALEQQTFGYTFSIDTNGVLSNFDYEQYNLYARQTSTYGFPYHPKFQPTSSQQILASNFISEPFLLEKIVLEISGAAAISTGASPKTSAIWSFFLLNSRNVISGSTSKNQNVNYTAASALKYAEFTTSSLLTSTILDVIDTIQIAVSVSSDVNGRLNREQLISQWSGFTTGATGSFQFLAKSTVKSPIKYDSCIPTVFSGSDTLRRVECILNTSGRNQYYDVNGRDWVSTFENPKVVSTGTFSLGTGNVTVNINEAYTKPNPYILLPTDKLTFGFQLPYQDKNTINSNTFIFDTTGINKMILYGSTLRVNPETNQLEEYHDTLNQLLCSDSIHEVIGE